MCTALASRPHHLCDEARRRRLCRFVSLRRHACAASGLPSRGFDPDDLHVHVEVCVRLSGACEMRAPRMYCCVEGWERTGERRAHVVDEPSGIGHRDECDRASCDGLDGGVCHSRVCVRVCKTVLDDHRYTVHSFRTNRTKTSSRACTHSASYALTQARA